MDLIIGIFFILFSIAAICLYVYELATDTTGQEEIDNLLKDLDN